MRGRGEKMTNKPIGALVAWAGFVALTGCSTISPPPPTDTSPPVSSTADGADPNFIPTRRLTEPHISKLWNIAVQQCYNANFVTVSPDRTTKNIICTKPSDKSTISMHVRFVDEGIYVNLNISGAAFALFGKMLGGGAATTEHRDMKIVLTSSLKSDGLLSAGGAAASREEAPKPKQVPVSAPASTAAPVESASSKAQLSLAEAQRRLTALGYQPGPADGAMGKRTAEALRRFQKERGLPQSGTLDATTSDALTRAN